MVQDHGFAAVGTMQEQAIMPPLRKMRLTQKHADSCRKLQKTTGTCRKPQICVCPLRFVPLQLQSCRAAIHNGNGPNAKNGKK